MIKIRYLGNLSGVSLLLRNKERSDVSEKQEQPVPEHVLREASILHQYAVAAYTVSAYFVVT